MTALPPVPAPVRPPLRSNAWVALLGAALAACTGTDLGSVEVVPAARTLGAGERAAFVVSVSNGTDPAVRWSVDEAGGGTVDPSGFYTAPQTAGQYHLRATLAGGASAAAVITVVALLPQILSLGASPAAVPLGWSSALSWRTSNADRVTLDQGLGEVASSGQRALTPQATTTYTLTAFRGTKSVTATAVLAVDPPQPPRIDRFTATPAAVLPGSASTLTWSVAGADAISIDQGVGPLTGAASSLAVQPAAAAVFTLTASNSQGSVSATAQVTVLPPPPPQIAAFTATPAGIHAGDSSALAWSVTGARSLSISPGVGDVTGKQRVSVSPLETTAYTLTATNDAGASTAVALVTLLRQAPVIAAFAATPGAISAGDTAVLAWSVTGAQTITLDHGLGDVTLSQQQVVKPAADTTWRLTATSPDGVATAEATVTVSLLPRPEILRFSTLPTTIGPGQGTTLSWGVSGATKLVLDPGGTDVSAKTGITLAPAQSTIYTLTASGAGGHSSVSVPVTVLPNGGATPTFTADPAVITAGESTTLRWNAPGATGLTLDQGVGAVTGAALTLRPTASTTYLLTIRYATGALTLPATVTVNPAKPPPWVWGFAADVAQVRAGRSTTLRWAVGNAGAVSIDHGIGAVTPSGSVVVTPAEDTTYTLSAIGGATTVTAAAALSVDAAAALAPADPGAAEITVAVDTGAAVRPISPLIYGYNAAFPGGDTSAFPATNLRLGGNRWVAYNWETNASSAGIDYQYVLDGYLGGQQRAAGAYAQTLKTCQDRSSARSGCATLVTIPNQGWVAADKGGASEPTAPQLGRFNPTVPRKGSALSPQPDTSDRVVYQDELVAALAAQAPLAATDPRRPILFALGNEPDLDFIIHRELAHEAPTYAALIARTVGSSAALKDLRPDATVLAPVVSGWHGMINLQEAPDAGGRNFVDAFLQGLAEASNAQGRRLLDVLDLHYFSDVWCDGQRINEPGPAANSPCTAAVRVQATRSLWDPAYVETSWITTGNSATQTNGAPIRLLPRLQAKIAESFPGTRLGISEYRFGGGGHISGAIAQADALGIFGGQGVWQASYYPSAASEPYVAGGFRAFRDYDGAGHDFGDTSVAATSSALALVSAYASFDAGRPERLVLVLINRDLADHAVRLLINHTSALRTLTGWQIAEPVSFDGDAVVPVALPKVTLVKPNAARLVLPSTSVTTYQLTP